MQPDGTELHVDVIKTPLHNEAGEVTGLQCMFWDVTETSPHGGAIGL